MAKAKTAGEKLNGTTETIETAFKNGTEALKTNFDKAVKGYDQMLGFSKDTVEAYVKAANVAGKGAETLHNEIYAYSKQSIEDSIAAAKALVLGCHGPCPLAVDRTLWLRLGWARSRLSSFVA